LLIPINPKGKPVTLTIQRVDAGLRTLKVHKKVQKTTSDPFHF